MNECILVVDDDQSIRRLATAALGLHGFQVYGARCGERGFECFMEHPDEIQLVLSDVIMPAMNGPEMVERILAQRPRVKVLFMTGYSSSAVLPAHHAKRFAVLGKPFTPGVLLQAVRDCLNECQ